MSVAKSMTQWMATAGLTAPSDMVAKPLPPLPVRKTSEPIRAWRSWSLAMRDGEALLKSLNQEAIWEGPILRADSKPSDRQPEVQGGFKGHGIYAWPLCFVEELDYSQLMPLAAIWNSALFGPKAAGPLSLGRVEGEVELFGRVVRHQCGFRAEAARMVRLSIKRLSGELDRHVVMASLAARYACDVTWMPAYDIAAIKASNTEPKPTKPKKIKKAGFAVPSVEDYKTIMRSKR
jgi:hypothetical protein